jgi:hypothetical protein
MDFVYSELQKNAFVKIGIIKNFSKIDEEFNRLELNLTPYIVNVNGKIIAPLDLEVASLIDKGDNPKIGGMGYGIIGDFSKDEIKETSLAKQCPEIINTIYETFGKPWIRRVKISKLPPNSNMLLHRHPYLDRPNCNNEVVIHIPIKTNSKVFAVVAPSEDNIKKQHFAVGEIWYLNTFYNHKFENNGADDRYHLWINLVWQDQDYGVNPIFSKLVEEKLYQGIKL